MESKIKSYEVISVLFLLHNSIYLPSRLHGGAGLHPISGWHDNAASALTLGTSVVNVGVRGTGSRPASSWRDKCGTCGG